MAAATWRSLLRARVLEAEAACSQVPGQLDTALGRLMDPLHRGDAAAVGVPRIVAALDALRQASSDLAYAVHLMGAARDLALCGGSVLPSTPLNSIDQIPVLVERNAVAKLDKAGERGEEAYEAMEKCRGHILVAEVLISCKAFPGVDGFIEAERVAATDALEEARSQARACAYHARGARDDIN